MITLASATDHFEAQVLEFKLHPDVTRVLEVARFYRIRHETDGRETHYWILTKPIHPYKAGTVLSLARLHALLFP